MLTALIHVLGTPINVLYALALSTYGGLMLLEAGYGAWRRPGIYNARESFTNLTMYTGFFLVNIVWAQFLFFYYSWAHAHRIADLGAPGWHLGQVRWWDWPLLFVLEDFCFYWFHRVSHKSRVFWAAHVTHHSSQHLNLSAAFRQTWTQFMTLPFWLPLPLLGFDPLMVMGMQTLSLFWQAALHTQLIPRLGPLEWIFNTPSHHRVHHGTNAPYLDRNFGGILIVWDRLFGSFAPEREPVRYGLSPQLESHNPLVIAFHEWGAWLRDLARSRSAREVWGYTFAPPGWKPGK